MVKYLLLMLHIFAMVVHCSVTGEKHCTLVVCCEITMYFVWCTQVYCSYYIIPICIVCRKETLSVLTWAVRSRQKRNLNGSLPYTPYAIYQSLVTVGQWSLCGGTAGHTNNIDRDYLLGLGGEKGCPNMSVYNRNCVTISPQTVQWPSNLVDVRV